MCFDYSSCDGQPQTCAAYPTAAGLVGTVEAVEDVGKVCGLDAEVSGGARNSIDSPEVVVAQARRAPYIRGVVKSRLALGRIILHPVQPLRLVGTG